MQQMPIKADHLGERIDDLRAKLSAQSPSALANRCGAEYDAKTTSLRFLFFEHPVIVDFPDLVPVDIKTGMSLPVVTQALLLYYLISADETPLIRRWISFDSLPDGRFYRQAFQGYTGGELVRHFGNDLTAFMAAACKLDGVKMSVGDAAFAFHALPRFMLAVVYYLGDDDFPPSCQILFDASAGHYLPTDVCAILGSMLTRMLLT